LSRGIL